MNYPFLDNLFPHPLSLKIYGLEKIDADLVSSIEKSGVLSPILITKKRQILSGHRRWAASKALQEKFPGKDFGQIPAVVFRGTELEAELVVIESNRQREKTLEQTGREFIELKRIETELAKQRQKQGPEKLPDPNQAGDARDKAAETLGMSGKTAEKLAKIVELSDSNEKAKKVLAAVNAEEKSISAAYKELVGTEHSRSFSQSPFGGYLSSLEKSAKKVVNGYHHLKPEEQRETKLRIFQVIDMLQEIVA